MNVFLKVTLQSLRKNKTRTIVTIIGIMLSAAMICAVTTSVSSMQKFAIEQEIYNDGDWHGKVAETTGAIYDKISDSSEVENVTYAQLLGYAKVDSKNDYKPYLFVMGVEQENFVEIMPVHLTSGRYPETTEEIILPSHLAENGNVIYKTGDILKLEIGKRVSEGCVLYQNNPFYEYDDEGEECEGSEELMITETRTYTVVGFYERPSFEDYSAPGYTALTISDEGMSNKYAYDVYFKMKDPGEVYSFIEDNGLMGVTNMGLLLYYGESRHTSFYSVLYGMSGVVIGLIMFGSISLIYNAFSISVSERTKQFGLLSSIGATKKQLKKMVFYEALAVSAVGIPLGILVGIGGIGITFLLIGEKFATITNAPIDLRLCVSPASIVLAVVVALVTVLISAWIPSRRATKVSAVEAIRQNNDIKATSKTLKTSKLAYKLFGLPGMLADKHYKRNKRKYRTTVASLFMSIVLFVSAASFTRYLTESVENGFGDAGFDLEYYCQAEEFEDITPDELRCQFEEDDSVTEVAYTWSLSYTSLISSDELSDEYLEFNSANEENDEKNPGNGSSTKKEIRTIICFVNDTEYEKWIKSLGLASEEYMDPEEPLAVALDQSTVYDEEEDRYETLNLLRGTSCQAELSAIKDMEGYTINDYEWDDEGNIKSVVYESNEEGEGYVTLPYEEACVQYSLSVGTTAKERPYFMSYQSAFVLVYPYSSFNAVLPDVDAEKHGYSFFMTTENHDTAYDAVRQTLVDNGLKTSELYDYAEQGESSRNVVTIIKVFSYGFIVLISLIAAANVFNTISTNISLRRREFAMLKSVGMTEKGFNRMMNYECLLYGTKALLLGLPVSGIITFLIYKIVDDGYETAFHLPWGAIGIATLSVFAVVFVTMVYSMSKIKKDNPIDALKNENI
ncbi:MAG: ABC transporter permease [Lachnospiraceae bacterium]